jgi:hypothetical protein
VRAAGYSHHDPDWQSGLVRKIIISEASTAPKIQERHAVLGKE